MLQVSRVRQRILDTATTTLLFHCNALSAPRSIVHINFSRSTPVLFKSPASFQSTLTFSPAAMATSASDSEEVASSSSLPPLSAADFRLYNHMAEHMEFFHNRFRQSWNLLWQFATTGRRPHGMPVRQIIQTGLDFTQWLTMHHDIEETEIFPILAVRMKEFDPKGGEMCKQHKQIHKGLTDLAKYLRHIQNNEKEFDATDLKSKMESWGTVLWTHLDEEVKNLGAENMRKYWTKDEMRKLPM